MVNNAPSVYDIPSVYDTAGGGGDGIVIFDGIPHKYTVINGFTILSENFKTRFNNGSGQDVQDDKYKYAFGYALNLSAVEYLQNNKSTIIPGWHVPTRDEYNDFFSSLSLTVSTAYTKLKSKLWNINNDDIGFSALPNGGRYSGGWQNVNTACYLRTLDGFVLGINENSSAWESLGYYGNAFPIRLFKD